MPSAMSCAQGVRGAACPTIFPAGRRSTATFAGGGGRDSGNASTRPCDRGCAATPGGRPAPARPSSTASRSRPRRWRVLGATTPARRSRGASATSWSTPWACSWPWSCTPPTSRTGTGRGGSWPGWGTASPRLRVIWADGGYQGPKLGTWLAQQAPDWVLAIVPRPTTAPGFQVLPRRWVVERTFAWLGRYRRLSKDYEGLPETSETWIRLAMIDRMLHRLGPA